MSARNSVLVNNSKIFPKLSNNKEGLVMIGNQTKDLVNELSVAQRKVIQQKVMDFLSEKKNAKAPYGPVNAMAANTLNKDIRDEGLFYKLALSKKIKPERFTALIDTITYGNETWKSIAALTIGKDVATVLKELKQNAKACMVIQDKFDSDFLKGVNAEVEKPLIIPKTLFLLGTNDAVLGKKMQLEECTTISGAKTFIGFPHPLAVYDPKDVKNALKAFGFFRNVVAKSPVAELCDCITYEKCIAQIIKSFNTLPKEIKSSLIKDPLFCMAYFVHTGELTCSEETSFTQKFIRDGSQLEDTEDMNKVKRSHVVLAAFDGKNVFHYNHVKPGMDISERVCMIDGVGEVTGAIKFDLSVKGEWIQSGKTTILPTYKNGWAAYDETKRDLFKAKVNEAIRPIPINENIKSIKFVKSNDKKKEKAEKEDEEDEDIEE